MKNLPYGDLSWNIDNVYRYLVPDFLKERLRDVGPMGGVSAEVGILLATMRTHY